MAAAVEVRGLTKSYGNVHAVRGIDLTVEPGKVTAVLGPNGAGKTTTMEILEGFRDRDAGEVRVLGLDPGSNGKELRERLGIVLQETAAEAYLTPREVLAMHARYYPHPRDVDEVIALVGLTEKANARVKTLSGGQKRRLDVGLGIIGDPELLFLDEPTTGYDPTARRSAWEVIRGLTGEGTTIVLTTHYIDEAQALADNVVVIAAGRVVAEGPPAVITAAQHSLATVTFLLPEGVTVGDLPVQGTVSSSGLVEITLAPADEVPVVHRLTGWALERGVPLQDLRVSRAGLEDAYLALVAETGDAVDVPA
ncbi:MAG: type transport system ATP-binding protein [Frankiaceae bacterium]|nr:type transport system ATP-binding protein [Frankiaceae bacterium]